MTDVSMKTCRQCGAPVDHSVAACEYCGAAIDGRPQYQPPQVQQPAEPQKTMTYYYSGDLNTPCKSKIVAGILAILLGGLGVHKFYLGRVGLGVLYLLFFWTYIPAIVGVIEGIIYLTSSDENFYNRYVRKKS